VVAGARTPEELETLIEDSFVMRDRGELGALYGEGAVLAAGEAGPEVRGGEAIGRALAELCTHGHTYVAGAGRVIQALDTALVVAAAGVHVLRRGAGGNWHVVISLLDVDGSIDREDA
jgi:hypothetical protein